MYDLTDKQRTYLLKLLGDVNYVEENPFDAQYINTIVKHDGYTRKNKVALNSLLIPRYEKYKKGKT